MSQGSLVPNFKALRAPKKKWLAVTPAAARRRIMSSRWRFQLRNLHKKYLWVMSQGFPVPNFKALGAPKKKWLAVTPARRRPPNHEFKVKVSTSKPSQKVVLENVPKVTCVKYLSRRMNRKKTADDHRQTDTQTSHKINFRIITMELPRKFYRSLPHILFVSPWCCRCW